MTLLRQDSASPRVHRPKRLIASTRSNYAIATLALLVLLVLWWIAARVIDDRIVLPSPEVVGARLIELLTPGPGSLWPDIGSSLTRVVLGLGAGIAVGVALGVFIASSRVVRAAIDPLLQGGRAIPPLAWTPLLIVWLGIGELSKVFLIFIAIVPVIAIGTSAGIVGVDSSLRRAAVTLGAGRRYAMRRVILPAALPEVLTSIRISQGLAWSCLVAAELIASTEGVGYRILQAGRYLETETIFVGILVIGLLAMLGDAILRWIERRAVPWKGQG